MTKKIIAALLAAVMVLSMGTTAFAANTNGEKHYEIDLNSVSDKQWSDSEIRLMFTLITKDGLSTRYAYWGEYGPIFSTQTWEPTLGKPVLLNYVIDEDTQQKLPITWAPIRLVANTIGVEIDWVEKTDTEEAHAVLHTSMYGDVNLYLNATEICYGDNVYREETYTFPDGSPIPLCLVRNSRIYIPVRGISTFLLSGETRYEWTEWRDSSDLEVIGCIDGLTEAEKTYGLNANYLNGDDNLNWNALPNLMAALEGQKWTDNYTDVVVWMYTDTGVNVNLKLSYYSTEDGLVVKGWDPTLAHAAQMPIIEGLLKDMVCDADREAIVNHLNTIYEHVAPGYTETAGATQEAIAWWEAQPKTYTFSEVVVSFSEWLEQMTIKSK